MVSFGLISKFLPPDALKKFNQSVWWDTIDFQQFARNRIDKFDQDQLEKFVNVTFFEFDFIARYQIVQELLRHSRVKLLEKLPVHHVFVWQNLQNYTTNETLQWFIQGLKQHSPDNLQLLNIKKCFITLGENLDEEQWNMMITIHDHFHSLDFLATVAKTLFSTSSSDWIIRMLRFVSLNFDRCIQTQTPVPSIDSLLTNKRLNSGQLCEILKLVHETKFGVASDKSLFLASKLTVSVFTYTHLHFATSLSHTVLKKIFAHYGGDEETNRNYISILEYILDHQMYIKNVMSLPLSYSAKKLITEYNNNYKSKKEVLHAMILFYDPLTTKQLKHLDNVTAVLKFSILNHNHEAVEFIHHNFAMTLTDEVVDCCRSNNVKALALLYENRLDIDRKYVQEGYNIARESNYTDIVTYLEKYCM